ncbi:MAG: LCP family protein [Clostridia bacterium]|nr:LCP family protein [Clostridia bacterium]
MHRLQAFFARVMHYLASHKKARIAACVLAAFLAVILALSILLHPRGTKNFLILGMDNYGSLDDTGRSDVTMLVQVDFTRTRISAVTFARDMFIEGENGRLSKINTIVRSKDEQSLCEAIERSFGIPIDGWVRLNFTSVIELVDAIGGAEVELTQAEVGYLNNKAGYYPDYPLAEGKSRLNGAQALAYARCRQLDNDFGRGERQSKLLAAMVKQTKKITAKNIVDIFNTLKHAWRSSLSGAEQVQLLTQALWLRGAEVQRISAPFEGYWHYGEVKGGVSGVVADLDANRRLLLDALGMKDPRPAQTP